MNLPNYFNSVIFFVAKLLSALICTKYSPLLKLFAFQTIELMIFFKQIHYTKYQFFDPLNHK